MKNKLRLAIHNNNGLYEAVFSGHNIKFQRTDAIWYSLEKTPPLYSNLVTIAQDWRPDDIFSDIELNYERAAWEEWSIKDSFGVLALSAYGFAKLFAAQWIYLAAADFSPAGAQEKLRYELADNEAALAAWRIAWDADEQLGQEIFARDLLHNPRVRFVAGYKGERIVSGCLVNRTDDVLGISNFFAPGQEMRYWSDMIGFIFASIACLDIVGYERPEVAQGLREIGFEPIGNLTVWLKKRNP